MTNLRLATPKYDALKFCPYCGGKLEPVLGTAIGDDRKECRGTFHFLVIRSDEEELL